MKPIDTLSDLPARLDAVRERIRGAAERSGRREDDITLVAVCKTVSPERTADAFQAGARDLGENRVAALVAKREQLPTARWHMIGQLQRNKARAVMDGATLIHSLDRRSLADTLNRHAADRAVVQSVLVQVNVGDDPAKGGCQVTEVDELVAYADGLTNLLVEGLMTVPPLVSARSSAQSDAARYFDILRVCRDRVVRDIPTARHLSMGMSADFEAAICEGSTMVRVGTDIFGARVQAPGTRQEERR